MAGRPSTQRYRRLIDDLHQAAAKGESLEACGDALAAVLRFLLSDRELAESGASRPLSRLLKALQDTGHGAKPPLLFGHRRPKGGAPTNLTRDVIRGQLAGIAELLIRAGKRRGEAGVWIVVH